MLIRKLKKASLLLKVVLIISLLLPLTVAKLEAAMPEIPVWSYGSVIDTKTSPIGQDAVYTWYDLEVENKVQKVHTVQFDPTNPNLKLVAGTKSGYVSGMSTLTKMAQHIDDTSHRVIAGINADFYEISGHATGVPNGIFISDGVILNDDRSSYAFGLKADGTSIYGTPQLEESVIIADQTVSLSGINRFRDANQLVLFTSSYGASTGASNDGVEVVLTIESGELKHGQDLQLTVEEVRNNAGNTPLTEGKVVLSASGDKAELLSSLVAGDTVIVNVWLNEEWVDVVVAVGGNGPLVKDGIAYDNVTPAGVHPRTVLGTKADGSIVFFEVDGRQPGFSEGLETSQVAQLLLEMGVVNALNLDGGGSSTMIAKLPGTSSATMVNSGSDGYERSIGNGLLLVNMGEETGTLEKLTVTPSTARVLTGSTIQLQANGLDGSDHPVAATGEQAWLVDEAFGTITADGVFTAGTTAGEAEIQVTSDDAFGTATVEVVDTLTELRLPDTEKTYSNGEQIQLSVTALRNGQVIKADQASFTWEVIGDIGTIDENGLFTATETSAQSGLITVSYGEVSASFIVNVGLPPVMLEDFETNLDRYMESSGARYNSMSISLEDDQDFVRSGNSSLKLSYDFIGTSGTSGAYLQVKTTTDRIEIPGYPEKIGMWVYGDAESHWLRGQLRDGTNAAIAINFTEANPGVDWKGWRYVEAAVPAGRATPLTIDMPVRYMETSNANKTAGTIYVDDIRAIYGPLNEDIEAPIVSSIYPEENAMVTTGTPQIKIIAQDVGYDPEVDTASTLIDEQTIRFYLDGQQLTNYGFYKPTGQITYIPTENLTEGRHLIKFAVRDLSGNQIVKEWAFNVNFGSPYFTYQINENYALGDVHSIELGLANAATAANGTFSFKYPVTEDGVALFENFSFLPAGEAVSEEQVIITNDAVNGIVSVSFNDLTDRTAEAALGQLQFNVNSQVMGPYTLTALMSDPTITGTIEIIEASVTAQDDKTNDYYGATIDVKVNPAYKLTWNHYATFMGELAKLQVTDRETGLPVEGVQVLYNGEGLEGVTNAQGELVTAALTQSAGIYTIQANKDTEYSAAMSFIVAPFTGTQAPVNINVTMGEDATTARNITWHTNPTTTDTVVELVEAAQFVSFEAENVHSITGTSEMYTTDNDGTYRVHRAQLTGLKPGTIYYYRVGDGKQAVSERGSFSTAAIDQESVNMLFFGDSQAASENDFALWGATVDAAIAANAGENIDLILHAGDMVDSGNDLDQWNWWFNAAQSELMNTTLVPIIGNHEVVGNNGLGDYRSFFHLPESGLDYSNGVNYSFEYGNAHVVVLNTESGSAGIAEQAAWLEEDLKQATGKWIIALFHQGPYGSTYTNMEVQKHWVPLFDQYGVDLVLTGHDHIYLRSKQLVAGSPIVEGKHATTYLIGGSSGPKFYGLDDMKTSSWREVAFGENTQIYTGLQITNDAISITVKTTAGEEVDTFEIAKTSATAMDISKNPASMKVNEAIQLEALLEPAETTSLLKWSVVSEHAEPLVELTADGLLTALKAGTITLQAEVLGQPHLTKTIRLTIRSNSGGSDSSNNEAPIAEESNKVENGTLIIHEIDKVNSEQILVITTDSELSAISLPAAEVLKHAKGILIHTPATSLRIDNNGLTALAEKLADRNGFVTVQLASETSASIQSSIQQYYGQTATDLLLLSQIYTLNTMIDGQAIENDDALAIEIRVDIPAAISAHTAGLYEVMTDGSLRYVDGKQQNGQLVAIVQLGKSFVVASMNRSFDDVPAAHWAIAFIEELTAKQIVEGVNENSFAPSKEVTRAEFTAMLVRALKLEATSVSSFNDVAESSWYYAAVAAAVEAGIVNGTSDATFHPNAFISREEMAVMLMRAHSYASGASLPTTELPFADSNSISQWAQDSVSAAYAAGFISGKTAMTFDPKGNGTRAESAKLLLKLYRSLQ